MPASKTASDRSIPPRNPARACRHAALAVRRDLRGAVPHPGLRLRHRRAGRARASRTKSPATTIRASPIRPSTMFEQRMCALEGAEAARATATGMAAVTTALMGQVRAGDHVVAAEGAVRLLPLRRRGPPAALRRRPRRWSTAPTSTNGAPPMRPNTKTFFLESPTNPTLEVIDIAAVAKIAHAAGATLVVDNVFATPLYQKPLAARRRLRRLFGDQAHRRPGPLPRRRHPRLARNSSRTTSTASSARPARRCRRSTPGCCSRGSRRWPVRVQRQTDTAATIADALAEHPKITRLIYPGRRRPSAGRDRRAGRCAAARRWSRSRSRAARPAAFRFQDALKLVQDQQQSRRRQEPDHPSGDHDAPAPHAGAARRARHQRRTGAAVMRARTSRRSGRGSDDALEGGVSATTRASARARGPPRSRSDAWPLRRSAPASHLARQA